MIDPERSRRSAPTRREFIALGIGAFVVASLPLAARRRSLIRRSVPVMGTIADIAVLHRDGRFAQRAIDAAIEQLRWVDHTMTRFSPDSDVGRANRDAAREAVAVTPATMVVLQEALRWAHASEGAFDPCLGRALELWDVGNRRVPPPAAEIERIAGRRLYADLELDGGALDPAVRFRADDVALDLGGIAKGYGVDRAVAALRDFGIGNGLVNVGGDLYALGNSEDGDPWKVGVRDPDDAEGIVATVEAGDCAVATSGDYIQYFQHAGRRYHHVLDPRTGEPARTARRSITIAAPTCMVADAAGTAVFGMEMTRAEALLRVVSPEARLAHTV
ncbi:MAG: FAD:protein FMN transferase [Gemmatimonadota bacterium]|nr:MAG: FAD:protein FMN transferase [Gemmatimonadota bacterium]